MPNLISVTQRGTPQDIVDGISFVKSGGLVNLAPEPVQRFAGDAIKGIRELRAVSSANPLAYVANDLFFPKPMADGTLTGAIQRHGYTGAGVDP